jgi:hypothetical protein
MLAIFRFLRPNDCMHVVASLKKGLVVFENMEVDKLVVAAYSR